MYCMDGWPYGDIPGYCAGPVREPPGYCIGPEYCAELPEYCEEYGKELPEYCEELPEYCAELLEEAPGYGSEPKEPICCWPVAAAALLLRLRCFRSEDRYRSCSFRFCI
jgi:hypothetical protein